MPAFELILVLLHVFLDLCLFRQMRLLPTHKLLRSQFKGFNICHSSSLHLIQSHAKCLADWKRPSWEK